MDRNDHDPVVDNDEQDRSVEQIRHPLENIWTFWLNTNKSKAWHKNLVVLSSFDTVEDYWCLYHYMKDPTELKMGQDYMLFKDDIKPMWEHKANKAGGRWLIVPEKQIHFELNKYWLHVVLLMIGETVSHSDLLCGAIFNRRSKNKICIWTRNAEKKPNEEMARTIKSRLGIPFKLVFYLHNSTSALYTV